MIKKIFYSQTKTVTFAAFILAISSLISKILGLLRDRLLAGYFGASRELDIYFAAFRIPDFIYAVLIMGGMTAVFLPLFADYFEKYKKENSRNEKEARWPEEVLNFVNNVLNILFIFLVFLCGLLAIFTPQIIKFIIPGFSPSEKSLAISLTRIMFLSPLFFGLASIFSGILHYFNRFLSYSLAPILYNLSIIFAIIFLLPIFGLYGLVYGVVLGAFIYLLIQVPAAKASGYSYKFIINFKDSNLKKIYKLATPRILGSIASQINLVVITAIASTLSPGSISIFNFSNNLHYFPIGLIGVSFALSSFPTLSKVWANGQKEEFSRNFSSTLNQIIFLIMPIIILIFLLRAQIVRLILGTGQFGWLETRLTAAALGVFSLGILAEGIIPFLNRAFFSLQETKVPVLISIFSMLVNIFLSFSFVNFLKGDNYFRNFFLYFLKLEGVNNIEIIGLPLALSISAVIQAFLLFIFFQKKTKINLKIITSSFVKIFTASFSMFLVVYLTRQTTAGFVNMSTFFGLLMQFSIAAVFGLGVYFLISFLLKLPEIKIIKDAFLKN